jgi:DNA-directed RNA polymerase specialized sigma24 family protein
MKDPIAPKNDVSEIATLASNTEVDELIYHYESLVFQMALSLTGDEEIATDVVEEVFVQIHDEGINLQAIESETIIHRLTYDAALDKLFGRIEEVEEEVYIATSGISNESSFIH